MQLLKVKVIEWEAAQDLPDEQMQQTEAAADLQELVDDLRVQKTEMDHMCTELIEQQLTQEEFDTVAAESARRNCKWLRTKQKIRLLHGSNHQKFISSDTSSEEPNQLRSKVVVSVTRRKQPSGMRRKTPTQNAGENAESWDEVFMTVYRLKKPSWWSSKRESKCCKIQRSAIETTRDQWDAGASKPQWRYETVSEFPDVWCQCTKSRFCYLFKAINLQTLCNGIPVQHRDFNLKQDLKISLNLLQTITIHVISNSHVICSVVKWITHSQRQTKWWTLPTERLIVT